MSTANLPAEVNPASPPAEVAMGIIDALANLKAIRTFVKNEFIAGVDFGVIPGTGSKNTLLQPGAQKACMYLSAYPSYKVIKTELGNDHVEFEVRTVLRQKGTHHRVGSGVGLCSTREKKYRYRKGGIVCPECGKDTVLKSKDKPGFFCWMKKGGCGTNFRADDKRVQGGVGGDVENDNIADVRNTVLKMAKKRSLVDAVLGLGCLGELFVQDIEDFYDFQEVTDAAFRHADALDVEVEPTATVPPARPPAENNSGYGRGEYASPEDTAKFLTNIREWIDKQNTEWLDRFTDPETGEVHADHKEVINIFAARGHMLKWAIETERLDPRIIPEDVKAGQKDKYLAVVYWRDRKAFAEEMKGYVERAKANAWDVFWRKNPDLAPPEWAEAQQHTDDTEPTEPRPERKKKSTKKELAEGVVVEAEVVPTPETPWEEGRQ